MADGLEPPTDFDLFPWIIYAVCGFAWLWMIETCFLMTFLGQQIYEHFAAFERINAHLLFRCVLRTLNGIIFQWSHHTQNISFPHRYFVWTGSQADVFRLLRFYLFIIGQRTFPNNFINYSSHLLLLTLIQPASVTILIKLCSSFV